MSTVPIRVEHGREEGTNRELAAGESVTESIVGLGAVVLGILGLLGVAPLTLASIAAICVGVALLLEGAAVTTRLARLANGFGARNLDISGGLGAESLAGVAAIALGILSLVRIDPLVLLPVAAIVIGAGLLLGGTSVARVSSLRVAGAPAPQDTMGEIAREGVEAAAGGHVLVGIGAVVLGILALLGYAPLTLMLVAMLSLGAAFLLSGAAIGGRLTVALRH
jgi:hypothetical protein